MVTAGSRSSPLGLLKRSCERGCRSKGGLDAERAERVKCKQEEMDRDRRNFEAMQVKDDA